MFRAWPFFSELKRASKKGYETVRAHRYENPARETQLKIKSSAILKLSGSLLAFVDCARKTGIQGITPFNLIWNRRFLHF